MGFHLTVEVGNGEWSLRHDREATSRPEPIADRFRDVGTWGQVNASEHIVRQTGMDEDFGAALDEGLDLGLPLLWTAKARSDKLQQNIGGRGGLAQEEIEGTALGHAVTTFAGEDNCAAVFDDASGGTHAFDTLIKVPVERMAAIRRDHHVERFGSWCHRLYLDIAAALAMGLAQVTGIDSGNTPVMGERDVDEKGWADGEGHAKKFLPQRIAIGDTEARLRMADVANVVARLNCRQSRAPGYDAFRPAAKPGEEMRLDEAGDDAEVGLDDATVYGGRGPVIHLSDGHKFGVVLAIVIDHFVVSDDLGGEHFFKLGESVGAMRAELVDEDDLITRMVAQSFEQPGDDAFVGSGTRVVREGNHHAIGPTKSLSERRAADGVLERVKKGSFLVGEWDAFSWFNDRGLAVGALNLVKASAKGEWDAHGVRSVSRD